MKVAEKDNVVHGMLEEEFRRSQDIIKALQARLKNSPRGALNVRRKKVKGKEYVYHYLVRREGERVINVHISEQNLPNLKKQIEEREKCRKEILAYKKRIAYLSKLLKKSKRESAHGK